MDVAIIGCDQLCENVKKRLVEEGKRVTLIDPIPQKIAEEISSKPYELCLALSNVDESNLISCALAKQFETKYGAIKTIATLQKVEYYFHKDIDIQRAFHINHIVFPDLLVVERLFDQIFEHGDYSRSFLYGNVLLRTIQITLESPLAGQSVAEVSEHFPNLLVSVIHRPRQVLASSQDRSHHLLGKSAELIFAHSNELILPDDTITVIGETDAVLDCYKKLSGEKVKPQSVCIVGSGLVALGLANKLSQAGLWVRREDKTINVQELSRSDVVVACGPDEEHNLFLALQAVDHGLEKVIAVLSDPGACDEAVKLGVRYVYSAATTATDRILELSQIGKVSSLMSLYNSKAEVLQLSVSNESSVVGIPLSVLAPELPKELVVAVIYTRGRVFIAGDSHILKPQDECLIITDPKHRSLIEKIM